MRRRSRPAAATLALALVAGGAATATAAGPSTSRLTDAVTSDGVMQHLVAFQQIADANDGTRASGTPGYDASIDYVKGLLDDAGYVTEVQPFSFDAFTEFEDATLSVAGDDPYVYLEDFYTMSYSGSGDVSGPLVPVDLALADSASSTSGCEAEDFDGFTAGGIAVIQRGACSFATKALNAENAGAVGAIVFNQGNSSETEDRKALFGGTLGEGYAGADGEGGIPVVSASYAAGERLIASEGDTADLMVDADVVTTETANLIAETPTGRDSQVVMAGAHLDSVEEGPGIEDNGTGSATILEIALQMAEQGITPKNKVRFAWWGAEEAGLVGSYEYTGNLTKDEAKVIEAYLNFDMVGSPNYVRFIYDGDGSDFNLVGPNGSDGIEKTFADWFASQGLASTETEFSGRSDYAGFIDRGIPAGGLFTGAEVTKTDEQVATYGGVAGASFDPCYHQACDSLTPIEDGADPELYEALDGAFDLPDALTYDGVITNVNQQALGEMSDAAAHAVLTYAQKAASVKGTATQTRTRAGQMDHAGNALTR